jgi:hypothetical protein
MPWYWHAAGVAFNLIPNLGVVCIFLQVILSNIRTKVDQNRPSMCTLLLPFLPFQ